MQIFHNGKRMKRLDCITFISPLHAICATKTSTDLIDVMFIRIILDCIDQRCTKICQYIRERERASAKDLLVKDHDNSMIAKNSVMCKIQFVFRREVLDNEFVSFVLASATRTLTIIPHHDKPILNGKQPVVKALRFRTIGI